MLPPTLILIGYLLKYAGMFYRETKLKVVIQFNWYDLRQLHIMKLNVISVTKSERRMTKIFIAQLYVISYTSLGYVWKFKW